MERLNQPLEARMKNWGRLLTGITVGLVTATVGLTSASAAPPTPGGPMPPAGSGHSNVAPLSTPSIASVLTPAKLDTVFVAVTPCRIVDTRLAGGQLANGTTRTFYVGGTSGFVPQGGKSGGCGIPVGATAVAASIGAVNERAAGNLTAFPSNVSMPLASNLNYVRAQAIASGGTVSINPTNAHGLNINNVGGPTDVFIDVSGYYEPQIEGMISPSGTVYSGTSRILSAVHNSTGSYTVAMDTDVSYCTPTVTAYSGYVYASAYGFNGNKVQVYLWYLTGGAATAYDGYFYLKVDC